MYSTWKNPRGKFPRGLSVFISTTFPHGKFPRHFHVEISMWKISACNLRGKIHVENFHADYPCSFLPLFHVENFHVTSMWKYPRGKFPRVFYVENSTWKISTRIICVHFYHFSTWTVSTSLRRGKFPRVLFVLISTFFPHGNLHVENVCVFSMWKNQLGKYSLVSLFISAPFSPEKFSLFPHYFHT